MLEKLIESDNNQYVIGTVKWFGGYNSKTGKENAFGFVDFDNKAAFVHRSILDNCLRLNQGQLVLFSYEQTGKGYTATKLFQLTTFPVNINDGKQTFFTSFLKYISDVDNFNEALTHRELKEIIFSLFNTSCGSSIINYLLSQGIDYKKLAKLISLSNNWNLLFCNSVCSDVKFELNLKTLGIELLPSSYIESNIISLKKHFEYLSDEIKIKTIIEARNISFSSILCLILLNEIQQPILWDEKSYYTQKLQEDFELFIRGTVTRDNKIKVENCVREVYKKCFISFEQYCSHQAISPIITPMLVKRKIFIKDMSFVQDIKNKPELLNDPEFWFLSIILPLVYANNAHEDIEKVALTLFWEALLSKQFDVGHPSIFKLFPQCLSLKCNYPDMDLSCEAFHWEKDGESIFLCRSKKCSEPRVLPDLSKSYLDFSLFDWLAHYGINYANEQEPSKRDFSIKLAGYVNRIRELHSRLNCRCCNNLMIPEMKYARVEIKTIEPKTGRLIITPINAAYRLTVFKCNTNNSENGEICSEYGKSYYINHCLHYKCNQIIDSRDLKDKCSEGRYFCPQCGSCCSAHSINKNQYTLPASFSKKHKELYQDSPYYQSFRPL